MAEDPELWTFLFEGLVGNNDGCIALSADLTAALMAAATLRFCPRSPKVKKALTAAVQEYLLWTLCPVFTLLERQGNGSEEPPGGRARPVECAATRQPGIPAKLGCAAGCRGGSRHPGIVFSSSKFSNFKLQVHNHKSACHHHQAWPFNYYKLADLTFQHGVFYQG